METPSQTANGERLWGPSKAEVTQPSVCICSPSFCALEML